MAAKQAAGDNDARIAGNLVIWIHGARLDNKQIVGCSASACLVLERVTWNLKIVGSILLPETSLEGNTVQPSLTDTSAWIWSNQEGSLLIIPCQVSVSAERSVAWVQGLLSAVQPAQLLVLGSMKVAVSPMEVCMPVVLLGSAIQGT